MKGFLSLIVEADVFELTRAKALSRSTDSEPASRNVASALTAAAIHSVAHVPIPTGSTPTFAVWMTGEARMTRLGRQRPSMAE
jgi:hypothetical protein